MGQAVGPMTESIPDRAAHFQKGVEAYRRGEHYEAHEFWEDLWQDEADDDRHRFFQALIQVASAVHKAKNDVGPRGCLRLIDRAFERLDGLPDGYFGVDLGRLRAGMTELRSAVERQLANKDGHCRVDDEAVPDLVQLAPPTSWINRAAVPVVPEAARSTWFDRGLSAYHDGEYFDAHEYWEELWRDYPEGPDRQFLQGLIQVAAAMHKAIVQGKPAPAARLLGRALPRLTAVPDHHWGLAVGQLVREGQRAKTALARLAQTDDPAPFDRALVPTMVRLASAPTS